MSLIDKMAQSANKLLEAESQILISNPPKIRNKVELVSFLATNIVELKFKTIDMKDAQMICTSNGVFVDVYSAVKEQDKKKAFESKKPVIDTKVQSQVLTFDLINNKPKTISLKRFSTIKILNFLPIKHENILLLDKVANDLLKKKK